MPRPIKTLLFSTLYPSSVRPVHGIFVETRLRELLKTGEVETKVVAPVPWFPFSGTPFREYGQFAATPCYEHRNGIDVYHPRYFLPPKVGMNIAPHTLARGALPTIKKLISDGFDFDLIDAHYYYPDGVAAGFIAKWLCKPFVVTARGSDLNLVADFRYPKQMIIETANKAVASIGVSAALTEQMAKLGAEKKKLKVFRNGVDLTLFHPADRETAKKELGWWKKITLISVGNLVENKGHDIAIKTLVHLPELRLAIIGAGPEEQSLRNLAARLGLDRRVEFAGRVPQTKLPDYYNAAEILLLASSREGWPNVLLEAMACGTPAIATKLGGIPEVIASEDAGLLVDERSVPAFVGAIKKLQARGHDRKVVRQYAEQFDWQATSKAQIELFSSIRLASLSRDEPASVSVIPAKESITKESP
jgi:teichuronic acid biosynthesis glycosyltransferase TuaC